MPRSLVPEGIVALPSDPTGLRAGQTYWQTTNGVLRTYNGTAWVTVGPGNLMGTQVFNPTDITTPPSAYPQGYSYGTVTNQQGFPANGMVMTTKHAERAAQYFMTVDTTLSANALLAVRYGYTGGGPDNWQSFVNSYTDPAMPTNTGWLDLTLNTGFTSFRAKGVTGAAFPAYKRYNGVVYLKGLVTPPATSSNESAFSSVPAGFRPMEQRHYSAMASTPVTAYLGVTAGGALLLKFALANNTSWFSLDGISYPVDQ